MRQRTARFGGPVWWLAAGTAATLLGVVVTAILLDQKFPAAATVNNLGQAVAAFSGAAGCAWGARYAAGRPRRALTFLAVACLSWAIGQVVWTYYEVALGRETPFPSWADVGYLGFLALAVVGVGLLPPPARAGQRRRQLLDAATVALTLTLLSSLTTLGAVLHGGAESSLALVISIAYPIGDVLLLSATLLALAAGSSNRQVLGLVAVSMVAMAASDTAFAYLSATDGYGAETLSDAGWVLAFCGLGLAGITAQTQDDAHLPPERTLLSDLLPYATAIIGVAASIGYNFAVAQLPPVSFVLVSSVVMLVMLRQYLALRDNRALNEVVAEREDQLRHLAYHDDLTGLANRPYFTQQVTGAIVAVGARQHPPSVAFIDLDGFKWVNDTLGHAQGDELLVHVARRLRNVVRDDDVLARLGGDEFAVLFTGRHDPEAAAAGLVEALRTPFHIAGQRLRVSASVGVARPEPGTRPDAGTLLQRADIAMFMVKRSGKNDFRLYSSGMGLEAVDDLTLQHALAKALDGGEITVAYQPVMDLRTGRMHGLEALARWQYQGIDVSPEVFVPTAERIGRAGQLTALVLSQACNQMAAWSAELGHHDLVVAVNISPAELGDPTLPARVGATLHASGIKGSQLVLEVTESGLLGEPSEIQDVLTTLRGLNVSLALDDFGTGYNTLAQLLQVRLDTVKIDRVFVQGIDHDARRRAFLEAMLMLLSRLGLTTVAEGVERPEQVHALRQMGCDMAQGFLLGRPYSGADITPLVLDLAGPPREAPVAGVPHPRAVGPDVTSSFV